MKCTGLAKATMYVYRNRNALERAYWARNVESVSSGEVALRLMARRDLRDTNIVEGTESGSASRG